MEKCNQFCKYEKMDKLYRDNRSRTNIIIASRATNTFWLCALSASVSAVDRSQLFSSWPIRFRCSEHCLRSAVFSRSNCFLLLSLVLSWPDKSPSRHSRSESNCVQKRVSPRIKCILSKRKPASSSVQLRILSSNVKYVKYSLLLLKLFWEEWV